MNIKTGYYKCIKPINCTTPRNGDFIQKYFIYILKQKDEYVYVFTLNKKMLKIRFLDDQFLKYFKKIEKEKKLSAKK